MSDRYIFLKIFSSRIKYFCGQIRDEETGHYRGLDRYPGEVIVCFSQNTTQSHDLPVLSKLWQRPEERPCDGQTAHQWHPGPQARSSWLSPGHRNRSLWSPWSTGPAGGRWATPPQCEAPWPPSPPPHWPRTSQAWPWAPGPSPSSHIGCHNSPNYLTDVNKVKWQHIFTVRISLSEAFFFSNVSLMIISDYSDWCVLMSLVFFKCLCFVYFSRHWCRASTSLGPQSSTDSGVTARPARPGADDLSMRSSDWSNSWAAHGLQQVRPRPGPGTNKLVTGTGAG